MDCIQSVSWLWPPSLSLQIGGERLAFPLDPVRKRIPRWKFPKFLSSTLRRLTHPIDHDEVTRWAGIRRAANFQSLSSAKQHSLCSAGYGIQR